MICKSQNHRPVGQPEFVMVLEPEGDFSSWEKKNRWPSLPKGVCVTSLVQGTEMPAKLQQRRGLQAGVDLGHRDSLAK